jgi:hypothetical protein
VDIKRVFDRQIKMNHISARIVGRRYSKNKSAVINLFWKPLVWDDKNIDIVIA